MNGIALGQPFRDISCKCAHSRREFQRALCRTGVASAPLSFVPLRAAALSTAKKAIVVRFGSGARAAETFAPEGQQYIPGLLTELIPQAAFYTQVVNRGILGHDVATASLATGCYATFNNFAPLCPHNPTIFAYYRRDGRQPASDAWVMAPGDGLNRRVESDQARYGDGLGATDVLPKQLPSGAPQSGSLDYERRLRDSGEMPGQVHSPGYPDVLIDSLAKRMQRSVSDCTAHARTVSSAEALSLYIAQHVTRNLAPGLIWITPRDIDIAHSGAFSLYLRAGQIMRWVS
jgi:hypothetical protein